MVFLSTPCHFFWLAQLAVVSNGLTRFITQVLIFFIPANMSTTSQKHRDFVAEPMGDKPVNALSGIGEVLGTKLEDQGFDKVS